MSGEKTEKATPKRRKEARREGQVARTQELGAWAVVFLLSLVGPSLMQRALSQLARLMQDSFTLSGRADVSSALGVLDRGARLAFVSVLVLGCAVLVVGVAAAVAQGGMVWATKAVKPSWKKLDPRQGIKRMLGPKAFWEACKILIKCTVVALLAQSGVRHVVPLIGGAPSIDFTVSTIVSEVWSLLRLVAVAGLVMAGADYAMARRTTNKQTKMSKEDVKQEHRQSEGDPMLKSAVRSRQIQMARARMMQDVASADVILVNPTHVAVALRYETDRGAPRVVARGAGVLADRIRGEAAEHRIPLVRDIPLARALYRSTHVGQEIPAELFAAVAQVLAFVISRRSAGMRGGTHRSPRTEQTVPTVTIAGRRRKTPQVRTALAD